MVRTSAAYYLMKTLVMDLWMHLFSGNFILKIRMLFIISKGNWKRRRNEKKYQVIIPPVCMISVTDKCNLKCKGCYSLHSGHDNYLSSDEIENVIEEAVGLGVYIFLIAGGEPLLADQLIPILSKYHEALFMVFTNGFFIDQKIVNAMKKGRHIIPVLSNEGDSWHNNNRRGFGMDIRINNAMNVLQKNKILFGFSTVIYRDNLEYVTSQAYFNSMSNKGASFGFFVDYMPTGNPEDHQMDLNEDDLEWKNEELKKRREKTNLPFFNMPTDEKIFGGCGAAGKLLIHIKANGDLEPCTFHPVVVGNIKKQGLLNVLQSIALRNERKKINSSPTCNGQCRKRDIARSKFS